jgi:hypothetical protein
MTSSRLMLAAATAAAAIISMAPAVTHAGSTLASEPLRSNTRGLAVSVGGPHPRAAAATRLVVPAGVSRLTGIASGSAALGTRTRLEVTRVSDGATLFTGSLQTFSSLQVAPGTTLEVRVQEPAGYAGLKAAALLRWS